ncbi:thiamine transporter [Oikeobacillus pervagus]|uniref:Thiamine transporter n=1 Tax=Oikeobacillus pervagus TaxID=1325931 RepID=A0AAJ1T2C9_9BACI|nr:energy-coupled thiamine transporter ThiT [Oikeobacillus pervagus]MDQ0215527.1 thiamine transporter [Oikeobacillus pervagus]
MRNSNLQGMIEAAIFAAFAFVLDLLPSIDITPAISISFAMVPIFIIAFRWGFKMSFFSGLLWGILQLLLGDAWVVTPIQVIMEYFIAFAFIGFAGLLMPQIQRDLNDNKKGKAFAWMVLATLIGSFARYVWHYIAGVIFFGEYAPEGVSPSWYSLTVNGPAMLLNFLLCAAVLILLVSTAPRLMKK